METEIQKENEEKKEYLKSYRRAVKREKDHVHDRRQVVLEWNIHQV